MDVKQDYSLKRNATSDTFDSEEDDSLGSFKKSRVSKINEEKSHQKSGTAVDNIKDGLSPTPKKARISANGNSSIISGYRIDSATINGNLNSTAALPTTSKDGKRANKPLMEKRRRARINQSLALLKTLILDSTKNDNTRHSKLEKADILELTVRYLQRQKILNSDELDKYKAGFQECTKEVTRFLDTPELHLCNSDSAKSTKHHITNSSKQSNSIFIEPAVKQRLLRHLNSYSSEIDLDFSKSNTLQKNQSVSELSPELCPTPPYAADEIPPNTQITKKDVSELENPEINYSIIKAEVSELDSNQMLPKNSFDKKDDSTLSVVQVIPSRLSDGQVVFLLPSHYMQLAEEFQRKAFHGILGKHGNPDSNEPIDFSIKREDCMWRPW